MNVLLYTMKIHNSNAKKSANSVISFEPYSNMLFSKIPKIQIVTLLTEPPLTVPVLKACKRVIVENVAKYAKGYSAEGC